jgi:hypothetical protein
MLSKMKRVVVEVVDGNESIDGRNGMSRRSSGYIVGAVFGMIGALYGCSSMFLREPEGTTSDDGVCSWIRGTGGSTLTAQEDGDNESGSSFAEMTVPGT